jgi:hypothetical protein
MPACHLGSMDHSVATSARRAPSIAPQAALTAVEVGWALARTQAAQPTDSRPGPVGQSVCGTKTKLITGRYRPVPGSGTGSGRSDPVDPVTRWDNLVHGVPHSMERVGWARVQVSGKGWGHTPYILAGWWVTK